MLNQETPDAATIQQRLADTVNVNNTGPFGVPERTGLIFSGCRFNRNKDCGCGMVLDSLVRDVRFVNCSFDENVLYGLELIAGTDNEGKLAVKGAAAYGVIVTACAFSGNGFGAIRHRSREFWNNICVDFHQRLPRRWRGTGVGGVL